MVEFIKREEIVDSITMPKGAKVTIFCNDEELKNQVSKKFRVSDGWCEDTSFALIYSDENAIFNIYNATQKKIKYILFGNDCLSVLLNKVLWRGSKPFCPTISLPVAICLQTLNENFYNALICLCVRKLESQIRRTLNGEAVNVEDAFRFFYSAQEKDEQAIIMNLINDGINCEDDIDGLVQSQTALTLLCKREEKNLKRAESLVLLARYVIKVYNIFVDILPRSIIPTDYATRDEVLSDFFSTSFSYENIPSEYEIRKSYYLLEKNQEKLSSLCSTALSAVEYLKDKYDSFRADKGYFYGCDVDDYKLSVFISPSLLAGNTLLQTLVQSGVGDDFL